jgi:hypothetical protein
MPLLYLHELHTSPLDGRIKERQSQKPLVRNTYTIERSSVSFEELQFVLQKNLSKPPDRWSIKEQKISRPVKTVLSCNHTRLGEG